ncbi:hypothetical protein [Erwinia rhapontici]|uniref:hypothetical protein n=1 Tax=Erwinia rhapontici TaxID=55212 RepID=UPI00133196CF|nr:hypothetical protein [Erwinia rhapontici]MBP2156856.1 hypothetical protein [Erwinia rhapontici]
MKKIIFISALLFSNHSVAGAYAEIAKSKFEGAMLEAIQATGANQKKIKEGVSQFPVMEKQMRAVVSKGLKENKSCLKIKRDFIRAQKEAMENEDWPDKDFVESFLSAGGDYVATVCLDMK